MRLNIHHKITIILTVTVAVILSGVYIYLNRNLREYTYLRIRTNLLRESNLAKLHLEEVNSNNLTIDEVDAVADQIGDRLGLRATIIGSNGRVLGDSELNGENLRNVENHLYRPEVQDALKTGLGVSRRFSTTIQKDMLYMARPFAPN